MTPILATALENSLFQFLSKKQANNLNINKALTNIHHDAPNSHVPSINFLELIVNLESVPVKIILYLRKITSIGKQYLIW